MAQADVLTPAGEVRTRQGTFLNTGSWERLPTLAHSPWQQATFVDGHDG